MAFTRGLYYPTIDFQSDAWLKNAAIYWDSLYTIVPASIDRPYNSPVSRRLYDEGILDRMVVRPGVELIESLTDAVLEYLETPEGLAVLSGGISAGAAFLHSEKLPAGVGEIVRLHPQKLPHEIRTRLTRGLRDDGWLAVDGRFAAFYMTILAGTLAQEYGIGLVTDLPAADRLVNVSRLGAPRSPLPPRWARRHLMGIGQIPQRVPSRLAEGLLADLVISGLRIDSRTSVKRIIEFRRVHADEIGRLRAEVSKLCGAIASEQSLPSLQQSVQDIYANQVIPAMHAFERSLSGSRIKWVADNVMKVVLFAVPGASTLAFPGLPTPIALLAGAGTSLTLAEVTYRADREAQLANSPHAVLLAARKQLGRA